MLTTCPHCGTRSPATSEACAGCARALYPLTAPPPPPPFKLRSRTNYIRLGITLGVVSLLVGAGASTGMLMNRDDARDDRADNKVSRYKMVDTGASPDPSPTTASPSPKVKEEKKEAASPSPSPSKTSSAPAEPAPEPSEKPSDGLPAGFRTVSDTRGFSLAVMEGWQRREISPTQIGYMPPTGDEYLHISEIESSPQSPFIKFLEMEEGMQESDNGYSRVRLEHNTFQGHNGARWEFTYTPESREKMRVVQQAYIDDAGTEYTIYFEARDRLWDAERDKVFSTALETWKQPQD